MNLLKIQNTKKIVLLFLCIFNLLSLQAQIEKTVNIAIPGALTTTLNADEKNTITSLTITGSIDARDFKTMRDAMTSLSEIDLEKVHIAAYTGNEGTMQSANTYPENQVPIHSFYNENNFPICPLISFKFPVSATSIGESAFFRCEQLSSVDIPSGIESIGRAAFSSCGGLVSLNISEGVSHLGEFAFNECTNLASVSIPASMRIIDKSAFSSCHNLSLLTISDGVISIGETAFQLCLKLPSVVLPSSLTSVSAGTFNNCRSLTSVTIPSSVTIIENSAFSYCGQLNTITLPSSVTFIGEYAFSNSAINSIIIPPLVKTIESCAFSWCRNLSSVEFPEGITSIGEFAFSNCNRLGSATLPASVTSIGESAFSKCGLSSFVIPASVKIIESNTFSNCENLSSIEIPEGVTSIREFAFAFCSKLGSVILPSSIISIGDGSFYYCNNLSSIVISEGVISIGREAIAFCLSLHSVSIPSSVTSIGMNAFGNCRSLVSVKAGYSVPLDLAYSQAPFYLVDQATCELQVPYGTKGLYAAAYQWKDFTNIIESPLVFNLSANIVTIAADEGSNASVEITSETIWTAESNQPWLTLNVTTGIGNGSLTMTAAANPSLAPRSAHIVVSLEGGAIQTITVTQEAKGLTLQMTEGELSAFLSMEEKLTATKLTLSGTIDARDFKTMREEMPNLAIIDLTGVTIASYTGNEGTDSTNTIVYPENEIPRYAFFKSFTSNETTRLISLIYPLSVTSIGEEAFRECNGLTSAILPSTMNSIGSGAFMYCPKLRTLTIPEGVQSIGAAAFENCTKLESVTIPSTVNSIGGNSFASCERLSSVILTEGVQSISEYAFLRCGSLSSVIIPSSVLSVGKYAFYNCIKLSSVSLSEGVASIGELAFSDCTSLISVTIPSSVTSIGAMAFQSCIALTSVNALHNVPLDLNSLTDIFYDVDKTSCILNVPYGSKELYAKANQWKDFINIVEFGGPVIYPTIIVEKGAPDQVIDLKTVFNDADVLSVTLTSNTNEPVVVATINGSDLALSFSKEIVGTSEIIITVLSKGKVVKSMFNIEVKLPISIDPLVDNPSILLYPNPTKGVVHVKLNSLPATGTKLFVYDTFGKVIFKSLNTKKEESFNLNGNPSGVYFIKVNGKEISKIVLQ